MWPRYGLLHTTGVKIYMCRSGSRGSEPLLDFLKYKLGKERVMLPVGASPRTQSLLSYPVAVINCFIWVPAVAEYGLQTSLGISGLIVLWIWETMCRMPRKNFWVWMRRTLTPGGGGLFRDMQPGFSISFLVSVRLSAWHWLGFCCPSLSLHAFSNHNTNYYIFPSIFQC